MKRRKWLRWGVRTAFLLAAVFFAVGGPLPVLLSRVIPAMSPLVLLSNSLAAREWYAGLFWGIPALLVLIMAVWRGRFFCRWICPAGTLHSTAALCRGRKRLVRFRFEGIFFWMIVAGACIGFPLWLFMDPLAGFTRIAPLVKGVGTMAALIPGLLLPLFLLLGVWQPLIWCFHFCPLGYLFDLCHMRRSSPVRQPDRLRRDLITGLVLGIPLAMTARRWAPLKGDAPLPTPVLPPGAGTPERFAALCTRCYACVDACPTRVITVRSPLQRILGHLFHPELNTDRSYCEEFCTRCGDVCPSGAIRALTEGEKRRVQIGRARVKRGACLAWSDGEYCMVCQEFCPYHAIRIDADANGLPRPVVDPAVCRGCGACHSECPAIRQGKAIIVSGVDQQTQVAQA